MLCALTGAAIWLLVATYWELPVSTTHSIVGGVMGFALVYGGPSAVVWNKRISEFPFVSGVLAIVLSWFVSPVLAGLISSGQWRRRRARGRRRRWPWRGPRRAWDRARQQRRPRRQGRRRRAPQQIGATHLDLPCPVKSGWGGLAK
ncbi:hypothetical protein Rsub_03145 [Raphidocelis subcapitata]|uniref:Phosphate transporter n=1 Tax=Raphidocelis subcapitata TaxID=307507 RepID=A0A2V0NYC8_9CHLO|nr:hypothetical protein Rsub_03145 [Raphidocelis subcapitata]|eukprot:GBF90573.1 hypothetical protein Rsub_03145 [Raphidocelis subcapitata]